jgi:type II secretory pathway component PulF
MPRFRYEALTSTGNVVSNSQEANSKAELVSNLKTKGYWATSIIEENASEIEEKRLQISLFGGRIKAAEVEFFTFQLATLINAHVTLPRALGIALEQISNPGLRQVVEQVKVDVEQGAIFNATLAQHPKVFSNLYVNMVKAGEAGGVLGVVLERLSEFAERARLLKNEVISSLFYPAILFASSIIALAVLTIFVIPKLTVMYADMGVDLPRLTQFLITATNFVSVYGWILLVGCVAIALGIRQFVRTESGRLTFDRLKLKLPLVGSVYSNVALVRFTRTMATLLENGVVLLSALRVVKDSIGNLVYSNAVTESEKGIERGSTLSRELQESNVFPSLVTHMITVGEESGNLEQMLAKLSTYYGVEIKKDLERLTSSIGPLVILVMGVVIGFIAVAMILPIYGATDLVAGQ